MVIDLKHKPWWNYIEEDLRELLSESVTLANKVEGWDAKFHDYAFVVFPAAKAFEGFLKKIFLDLELISREDYHGKRFRVGKALNPSLDRKRYKGVSIYDQLVDICGESDVPSRLWNTWREARNLTFHWFPEEKNAISFKESKEKIMMIVDSMDKAFVDCKITAHKE